MFDKDSARLSGYDRAPRQQAGSADAAESRSTFRDLRGTLTEEQVKAETARCLGCGSTVVDADACVGCGICTTKCKFDAIHLKRVTDEAGAPYEKTVMRTAANAAKRAGMIAVKKIGRK